MASIYISTPYVREFIMVLSSDHVSPATGKSVTVQISKGGAAYVSPAGAVAEIGSGRYSVSYTSADTNTIGDLGLLATAALCDNTDLTDQVVLSPGAVAQAGAGAKTPINGPILGRVIARSDVPLFARLRDPSTFAILTQAAISTITYNVEDLTLQVNAGSGTLTIASVVFNSLQQSDASWTQDSAAAPGADGSFGYNFKWTAPASLFAFTPTFDLAGNIQPHKFQIDIKFALANGGIFEIPFVFPSVSTFA